MTLNSDLNTGLRYPDFIIGGAPKCGTTSVHFILDQHPDIGLPDGEIHYFDADDAITHSDFIQAAPGQMTWFDPTADVQETHDWYTSRFEHLHDNALIGEDSTTYIFSAVAAERIHKLMPDAKLVFMLRNPVNRAYSQYWHMMNSARTSLPFTKAISRYPNIILGSTYTDNLRRYFARFPREQIKVMLFEDFVADNQAGIDELTDFLGAAPFKIDPEKSWFNKTLYTRSAFAQRAVNLIGRPIVKGRYKTHMSDAPDHSLSERVNNKIHHWFFKYIYPPLLTQERPPAMSKDAREYLTKHLTVRNAGLSELLGRDLSDVWGMDV